MQKDDFIGTTFGTDNQLEVTGWDGSRDKSHTKLYTVKCHVCASDPELFSKAEYKRTKVHLLRGLIPCGCGKQPKWTKEQFMVLLNRRCIVKNLTLLEVSAAYKGCRTEIRMKCNRDGHEWNTKIRFILNGSGCPECQRRNQMYTDDEWIAKFMATGKFEEGTIFQRVKSQDEKVSGLHWNVICLICANDEYVKAGLCTGVFKSVYQTLALGCKPCRCSRKLYTKPVKEYEIRKIITEERLPYKFVGWESESEKIGADSKAIIVCDLHGEFRPRLGNFIDSGKRCSGCRKHGFDKFKDATFYVLKIEGMHDCFTGFGITSDLDTRLSAHSRHLNYAGYTIAEKFLLPMSGEDALNLETKVKSQFEVTPRNVQGFKKEAIAYSSFDAVVNYARTYAGKNSCQGDEILIDNSQC